MRYIGNGSQLGWPRWRVIRVVVAVLIIGTASGCSIGPVDTSPREATSDRPATRAPASSTTPANPTTRRTVPRLIDTLTWVQRDGERALRVVPTTALRQDPTSSAARDAWRQVVTRVPAADTPGMFDQFRCHVQFASGKAAWYLEPARPAVGYAQTVLAGCNPGDVIDVG